MKITAIKSHVLSYKLDKEVGYSQRYYNERSVHLVEISTDEGLTGWGECFGPGTIAIANKTIIEMVIQPMLLGRNPIEREVIWHQIYNYFRDHGQKGMPIQALSGIDIALWDLAGKISNQPLYELLGGKFRDQVSVYGYGMMLNRGTLSNQLEIIKNDSIEIKEAGYLATKMKIGLGVKDDIRLVQELRKSVGKDFQIMVDANHCYTVGDALYVGHALDELDVYWFEEPVAPEDYNGYRRLRNQIKTNIAGGEAEFTRWGWRHLFDNECIDIAQPEVCSMGGISEYLKVLAMAHTNFIPVVNHVWGSAISIATNLHLLAAMPPVPGGMFPREPMLEFDTTNNLFVNDLLVEPLDIEIQVSKNKGFVKIPDGPGLGVEPNLEWIHSFQE